MNTRYNNLLTALSNGSELTAKQIATRFRVSNPYDLVYRLRDNGHKVEMFGRTNTKGVTRNFYKMVETKRKRLA